MGTVTRQWWKATAAVALTGGGLALFGTDPAATAQVPAQPAAKFAAPAAANPMWTRSSSPLAPAAASAAKLPPSPGAVIPASAVLPAAQLPTAGAVIQAKAVLPTAQPPVPPLPALPGGPPQPPPPVGVVSTPEFKAPPLPQLPGIPAPAAVAPVTPPVQPAKSAPAAQPAAPAKTVSPLQVPDTGNSVKTDAAWKAPTTAPAPRAVTAVSPPAAIVSPVREADRPKPAETPVQPTERDVFPLPRPPAPAVPVAAQPTTPMLPVLPAAPAMPPPLPPTTPVATTPGADPMMFKSTAAAAVLGGALVMPQTKADAPAAGGAAETQTGKDAPKTADEKLTDIQKDLRRLTELLDGKRDETGTRLPSDPGLVQQVRDLKDKMAALETQLNALKSTSLRPPAGGTPGVGTPIPGVPSPMPAPAGDPAAVAKGTVRVVNEYPVEITMVVNGRSYRVSPNATQDIHVAAGDFSYQLLSAGTALAPTRSSIRDREVVTLRIK